MMRALFYGCLGSLALFLPSLGRGDEGSANLASFNRILILGDSISHHSPKQELGWSGNWGMAASAEDKDYAHLFLSRLTTARGALPAPTIWIVAEGGGKVTDKLSLIDKITAFHADLALIQLGENDNTDVNVDGFQKPYEQLIEAVLAGNPHVRILCCGVWGYPNGNPEKDAMIKAACDKYHATFVSLRKANADPDNRALAEHRFTNSGVNWHPGDRGMAAYADAFWAALTGQKVTASETSPAARPVETVTENWSQPPSLSWSPAPPIVQEEGKNLLKISAAEKTVEMYSAPLVVTKFAGRKVRFQVRVRGDSISAKPKPWNGVKVRWEFLNAEGKTDLPQYDLPEGTFPWTDVVWLTRIPDNVVSLRIALGLEQVSGTAWFDAVSITTVD